ncbi:MAG: nucleotidyltransferase family protein [Sphingomonadaceae bacterium]|nr:nucleotidyltransferase family protein [Sphingomonadaceae bacterium]
MSARLLVTALVDPGSTIALSSAQWTALIAIARAEQLIGSLAYRLDGLALPEPVENIMAAARASAEQQRLRALWEAEMARRALAPLAVPVVLLKGTAFVAAGLDAGVGRSIGDLDILVPRARIDEAEAALLGAGWERIKADAYDDAYYRRWMHELPPLIHVERDRMIDVHHTILPPTARPKPDAARMIAERIELGNGLAILSPADIVIHAAAHLFADGDLAGGLRNLWDIDRLCREFGERDEGSYLRLVEEAYAAKLGPHVLRALRLTHHLYATPVPAYHQAFRLAVELTPSDRLFLHRLLARDAWGRPIRSVTRFGFYVRSHALRMPPHLLARHLAIKWWKSRRSA